MKLQTRKCEKIVQLLGKSQGATAVALPRLFKVVNTEQSGEKAVPTRRTMSIFLPHLHPRKSPLSDLILQNSFTPVAMLDVFI